MSGKTNIGIVIKDQPEIEFNIEKQKVGDPEISIYRVSITDDRNGIWEETLSSREHLEVFLRGAQAAFSFANIHRITILPIP